PAAAPHHGELPAGERAERPPPRAARLRARRARARLPLHRRRVARPCAHRPRASGLRAALDRARRRLAASAFPERRSRLEREEAAPRMEVDVGAEARETRLHLLDRRAPRVEDAVA